MPLISIGGGAGDGKKNKEKNVPVVLRPLLLDDETSSISLDTYLLSAIMAVHISQSDIRERDWRLLGLPRCRGVNDYDYITMTKIEQLIDIMENGTQPFPTRCTIFALAAIYSAR